jgi:hypothetical protein
MELVHELGKKLSIHTRVCPGGRTFVSLWISRDMEARPLAAMTPATLEANGGHSRILPSPHLQLWAEFPGLSGPLQTYPVCFSAQAPKETSGPRDTAGLLLGSPGTVKSHTHPKPLLQAPPLAGSPKIQLCIGTHCRFPDLGIFYPQWEQRNWGTRAVRDVPTAISVPLQGSSLLSSIALGFQTGGEAEAPVLSDLQTPLCYLPSVFDT